MARSKLIDKRLQIDKANSTIIAAVTIASIVVSVALVLGKVLWDTRQFQGRVITAKEDVKMQLDSNVQAAEDLKSAFEFLESGEVTSQIVLDALPSKYDFPALATSIEKIVTEGGYVLTNFGGDDESANAVSDAADPEPLEIPFSVDIKGTYEDIQKFVADMERSIRPFRIDSMNIRGADENIRAEFKITTYYQPAKNLEISTTTVR